MADGDVVPRRRLLRLLDVGTRRRLTIVGAPAGFGKSVLLSTWVRRMNRQATVVHVAPQTAEPAAFWSALREALRGGGVAVDELSAHETGGPGEPEGLGSCMASHRRPVVLVIDMADQPLESELGAGLDELLRCGEGRARVVLGVRNDPVMPLHLYRIEDELTEIRASDLAFTLEEVAGMARRRGVDLSATDAAALWTRTEGWPVGVVLALGSLAAEPDVGRALSNIRGDTGALAAYFTTEVLDTQPGSLRSFLLHTSIVDELTPGLAGVLTTHWCRSRTLEFVAHGNAFVQMVDGSAQRVRYHPLFREFLRAELRRTEPDVVDSLHGTAAAWLAEHGRPVDAVRHAAQAGAWAEAAHHAVHRLGLRSLLSERGRRELAEVFDGLPDDVAGVEAALVRAAVAAAELDPDRCEVALRAVDAGLSGQSGPEQGTTPLHHATLAVLRALSASLTSDLDGGLATAVAAAARLRVAGPGLLRAHPELPVLVDGCLGRVHLARGDFTEALGALDRGARNAAGSGWSEAAADLSGMAALTEAARGRLRQAVTIATRVTHLDDSVPGVILGPRSALLALAWVCVDQLDLACSRELLRHVDDAPATFDIITVAALQGLVRGRMLRADGDLGLARAELQAAGAGAGGATRLWLDQALLEVEGAARHAHARDDATAEPSPGVRPTAPPPGGAGRYRSTPRPGDGRDPGHARDHQHAASPSMVGTSLEAQVESWMVRAAEAVGRAEVDVAQRDLERALRLAAPERLRRPFADAPAPLRELLRPGGDLAGRHPWLVPTSAHVGRGDQAARTSHTVAPRTLARAEPSFAPAPLTAKEREVLEYLADLLTTDEIAARMYVSVSTVRSHIRHILRKLGVARRNEAVRRAWELGLLPSRPAA